MKICSTVLCVFARRTRVPSFVRIGENCRRRNNLKKKFDNIHPSIHPETSVTYKLHRLQASVELRDNRRRRACADRASARLQRTQLRLLESEAFSILQRYQEFLLEYLAAAVRRQHELVEARMRHRQPGDVRHTHKIQTPRTTKNFQYCCYRLLFFTLTA